MEDNKENLSPAQIEENKTRKERAQDIAYTTNHAVVCTITDFIDPYVNKAIQKKLGSDLKLSNAWASELIGDFGAIPFTVGMQRFFPSVMSSISKYAEPIFRKAFENGTTRDAKAWAKRHGHEVGSKEYEEYRNKIYNYEVSHLPQALMWTASSVVMNVGAQRALGNKAPVLHMAAGKVGGAILTAGLTVGGRSIFPRNAEKLDKFTSEKLFLPIENKINKVFGDDDDDDKKSKDKNKAWSKRVKTDKSNENNISV